MSGLCTLSFRPNRLDDSLCQVDAVWIALRWRQLKSLNRLFTCASHFGSLCSCVLQQCCVSIRLACMIIIEVHSYEFALSCFKPVYILWLMNTGVPVLHAWVVCVPSTWVQQVLLTDANDRRYCPRICVVAEAYTGAVLKSWRPQGVLCFIRPHHINGM